MSWLRAFFAALLFAISPSALADTLRPGYLELTQTGANDWRVTWKAPVQGGMAMRTAPSLPEFCRVMPTERALDAGTVKAMFHARCARPLDGATVGLSGLTSASDDALIRIAPLGRPVQAARITAAVPNARIADVADRWQVGRTYLTLGVEHILLGFDHLLFVLSLVLLIRGGWAVAKTVTAFTVAHSITLAGTSLGLFLAPRQAIEICIALSILFLAVEIVKARDDLPSLTTRFPWIVAFAFGLLHGFGFAGALAEIGLPDGEVAMALLAFNLGVEIGQLAIVATGVALLAVVSRYLSAWQRPIRTAAAYAIGATAAYWMFERMIV